MAYLNIDDGMDEHPKVWHKLTASALRDIIADLDDDPRTLRAALLDVGYIPKSRGPKDRMHLAPARKPIPAWLRSKVYERDGHACVYCGATENLTLDHIIPWSDGGPDTEVNLQTLCRSCNARKGTT